MTHRPILNRTHPLNRGRALWLRADRGVSGTSWCDLVRGQTATLTGFASGQGIVSGYRDGGRPLLANNNSNGAYADLLGQRPIPFSQSTWTLAIWVYFRTINNSRQAPFIRGDGAVAQMGILVNGPSPGSSIWRTQANGTTISASAIQPGNWYRLMVVGNGTAISMFKNGTLDTTGTAAGSWGSETLFQIGTDAANSRPIDGFVDSVSIWDYPLPDSFAWDDYVEELTGCRKTLLTPDRREWVMQEVPSSTATSFSASSALSLGASAAVVQGMSASATSALSLGSAAALTFVGPPLTISTTSALSLGAASTVTLTSPALSFSASSALSLGSSAALSFATATTISATSALSLGASAAVTLTSQAVSFSASSALSLGASAAVTLTTATTISAASSLSLGASAAVTLGGSVATAISASSSLSLGASVQVAFAGGTLPADFVAAVIAAFKADANLSGFGDRIWTDEAPSGTSGTYAVVTLSGGSDVLRTDVTRVYDQSLRFRAYDADADTAAAQGLILKARTKAWGPLDFEGGFSLAMTDRGERPVAKARALGPNVKPRYFYEFTASARVNQSL